MGLWYCVGDAEVGDLGFVVEVCQFGVDFLVALPLDVDLLLLELHYCNIID